MANGLRAGDGGAHLMTFHPRGGSGSAQDFHADDWLDFNMRQNGHGVEFTGRYDQTRVDYDRTPAKPVIGPWELDDPRGYYQFVLAVLVLSALATLLYVRGRGGRDLIALRDNENAARALGVPSLRRKVEAFLVAGALAGIGGSVFAHGRDLITPSDFEATASIWRLAPSRPSA